MAPRLKGTRLAIDSRRKGRGEEGWRLVTEALSQAASGSGDQAGAEGPAAPATVAAAPRLHDDLLALERLAGSQAPPLQPARPSGEAAVALVLGDASGAGLGQSSRAQGDTDRVEVELGLREASASDESSSCRELARRANCVDRRVATGEVSEGSEVFLLADNFVAERCFSKGSSKSRALHELALRLREPQARGKALARLTWAAGARATAQGADGASRGDLPNGAATGENALDFAPLNKGVDERSPELITWLQQSLPGLDLTLLSPDDWFHRAHVNGNFTWSPPPAAAEAALDQLVEARRARPRSARALARPACAHDKPLEEATRESSRRHVYGAGWEQAAGKGAT